MNFSKVTKKSAQVILNNIKKSKHILLCFHPGPDGDSIGSCLGLYHFLKQINKQVTLIKGDSDLPSNFSCLTGFNKIMAKNYGQLNLKKFDLFIALDASSVEQISKLNPVTFPPHLKTIAIDHHATNTKYADINLVDTTSVATAQIIAQLLFNWTKNIGEDIGLPLMVGIYTDSGGFKYWPTNQQTFKIVAKLSKYAPNFHRAIFEIENNKQPDQLRFKALALNSIETFFSNQIAISSISRRQLVKQKLPAKHAHDSGMSNILISVSNWKIGISIVEKETNSCYISLRTRDARQHNVSKIATALGGGGHPAAAGALVRKSLPATKRLVLQTIQDLYPELGKI
ncbi:hypothetical protein DRH14_03305 [Candidatus Shapirobacteria bacterium]|nr:MAG: hypothetical protein DRH14_03305 [Candidatus Shapirobacteria bacterium]